MLDNGELKKETAEQKLPDVSKEPKTVLTIIQMPDGSVEMKTNLLPPMVIYLFESLKYSLFSNIAKSNQPLIQPHKGGIMNFIRGGKK